MHIKNEDIYEYYPFQYDLSNESTTTTIEDMDDKINSDFKLYMEDFNKSQDTENFVHLKQNSFLMQKKYVDIIKMYYNQNKRKRLN